MKHSFRIFAAALLLALPLVLSSCSAASLRGTLIDRANAVTAAPQTAGNSVRVSPAAPDARAYGNFSTNRA